MQASTSMQKVVRNCRLAIQKVRLTRTPQEVDLFERCRRASLAVDHQRARYERLADERDGLLHEREAWNAEREEFQARVAELEGQVMDLTDQLAIQQSDVPIRVTGPTRNAS